MQMRFIGKTYFNVVAFIVAISMMYFVFSKMRMLKDQRELMNFGNLPTTIVYDDDPVRANRLARSNNLYENDDKLGAELRTPSALDEMPPPGILGAPAFIHSREAHEDGARLVIVLIRQILINGEHVRSIQWEVVRPGTYVMDPVVVRRTDRQHGEPWPVVDAGALRVFSGQIDPKDNSHFTMEFDMASGHNVLDGWLRDDETLKFSVRTASGK